MEVACSKLAAGLTAEQVYLCERTWSLLVDVCVQTAAEALFLSSVLMRMLNGREEVGSDSRMVAVETQSKGTRPRSDEGVGCFLPMIEDLTKDANFIDGPDTSVRFSSDIKVSVAAKSKEEVESEDDKDDDDEDDDNEEDFGEEDGGEDVSSEDGGEENNGVDDAEGGGDEDDEDEDDEEEEANDNNENNGSDDDEDDEEDEEEVVEEEDDHGEGEKEEDDEGEDKDEKEDDDEDEDDEESLHPAKKRKK